MTEMQSITLGVVNDCCGADHGFYTGEIADRIGRQPGLDSNRQHSALISRTLRELKAMGLVARLDDKKPVIWCRKG